VPIAKAIKPVRDARTLRAKAISSLRLAMAAFNSYDEDGRVTTVLLHLQHASEMLLKAALVQAKVKVFDKDTGQSLGFEKCLRLCQSSHGLTPEQAGIMRAIDSLRDAAQHWFVFVSEDLLYLHTRALVTAFDDFLKKKLDTELRSHIPPRVLPISTSPPADFAFLVDREYKLIHELLQPGRRRRDEARARIRALLAMEALVANSVQVSEKDINRVERGIREQEKLKAVFPRLISVGTTSSGEGATITVRFSKKEGAPVRYLGGDDPEAAAAVREVDLRKKYHLRASELSRVVGVTAYQAKAIRTLLDLDQDPSFCHVFEFGKTKIACFSDNASRKMKEFIQAGADLDKICADYRKAAKSPAASQSKVQAPHAQRR
jgi:hypothetical protein